MNFKIGQKVICKTTLAYYHQGYPQKGKIYTLSGFIPCHCGDTHLILEEFKHTNPTRCEGRKLKSRCFVSWAFEPLAYDTNINQEILTKHKPIEEKPDIPVKIPEKQEEKMADNFPGAE